MKIPNDFQRRFNAMRAEAVRNDGSGGVSGFLNVCGVMDSWHSVVFPGAWGPNTSAFVKDGKKLYGHQWSQPEIGIVLTAEERTAVIDGQTRSALYWETEFHDDEVAQRIRKIVNKRFTNKKTVDFSVGFWPNYRETAEFKNGSQLWDYAVGKGCDMSLFDPKIRDFGGWCWAIPEVDSIAEGSIVNDGATPGSEATDARSFLHDLSSGALAATLPDHLDSVLAAVQGVTSRVRTVRARRVVDNRELSNERAGQVDELITLLQELRGEIATPIQPIASDDLDARFDELALSIRFANLRA